MIIACAGLAVAGLASAAEFTDLVVRGEERAPVSIVTNGAGHAVLDFGQHAFGWLEVRPPAAGEYTFVWGELLNAAGGVQTNAFFTEKEGRVRCAVTKDAFTAGADWVRIPYQWGNGNAYNRRTNGRFGTVMPFRWLEVVDAPFPLTAEVSAFLISGYSSDSSPFSAAE